MNDNEKTKTELVMENVHLRRKLAEAEQRLEWAKGNISISDSEGNIYGRVVEFRDATVERLNRELESARADRQMLMDEVAELNGKLADRVPRRMYEKAEKSAARRLRHIDEVVNAIRKRNWYIDVLKGRIRELEFNNSQLGEQLQELIDAGGAGARGLTDKERRVLDMWPRFEDGEPVMRGDMTEDLGGEITEIEFFDGNGCVLWNNACNHMHFSDGERVKRPAPEVTDADGVPIEVGDKLYDTETGCGNTVRSINANGSIEFDGLETRGWLTCRFTHTEPVFDADGVPIEVGDTVYEAETGEEYKVDRVYDGTTEPDYPGHTVRCRRAGDCLVHVFKPCHLTHREPDSWDRLMRDATMNPFFYCAERGIETEGEDGAMKPTNEAFALDLVRRAKALAGIEVG